MGATYILGPFRLDAEAEILFRGAEPVALGQRAVALLRVLVERPRIPVSKDALIEAALGITSYWLHSKSSASRVCPTDWTDEPITTSGQSLNPTLAAGLLAKRPTQSRDLYREVTFLDNNAGPSSFDQRIL